MFSDRGPTLDRSTAVICTNTSFPPSSGVMKPNPFDWLKNFTVPFCRMRGLLAHCKETIGARVSSHAGARVAKADSSDVREGEAQSTTVRQRKSSQESLNSLGRGRSAAPHWPGVSVIAVHRARQNH